MTIKQAYQGKSKVDVTTKAIMDKCRQLLDSGCLDGISLTAIPSEYRHSVLLSHMFLKDKTVANGCFDKRKARLVANGNEENKNLIDETQSPTVNSSSVLLQLALTADRGSVLSAYDIKGAFLKTPVEFDRVGKRLFVKTNPDLAEHFIKLRLDLAKCRDQKGQLYFEVKRWLYGHSEASYELNVLLDTTLRDMGFQPSRGDRCLYTRRTKDGKFTIASTHFDDLMVTPKDRDDFERDLKKHFEINAQRDELSYLGMNVKCHQNGDITVDQEGYTKDLLKRFLGKEQMRKLPPTPANADILEHDGKDPPCDRTEYPSKVMTLMHLMRFMRIDILYPVTVLATRSASCGTLE
jgi:hypothetical protein